MAEDAANRMADRLMNAPHAAPLALGNSPELQALEEGLRAVRESASSADQRNQETLQAVHDTLEQIVTKLAELETAAIGQQVAAAAAQGQQFAAPHQQQDNAWRSEPHHAEPAPEAQAPDQDFAPAQSSSTPDSRNKPFEGRHAASEANPLLDWLSNPALPSALHDEVTPADDPEAATDDFIAAARRAAHASAQKSILASLAPGAKSSRKFSLPFLKGASKPAKGNHTGEKLPPEIKPAVKTTDSKRRTLVLAGLVLLAAVSAFTFNMLSKPQKTSSVVAPAAIEGSIQSSAQPKQGNAVAPVAGTDGQVLAKKTTDSLLPGNPDGPGSIDDILTGSLPVQKTDATLASIVAEPGTSSAEREMPPEEIGTEALRSAAESGDPSAQFIVATRYLDGEGVPQDVNQAAHWYQKAALAGSAPAQYRLATLFERGRGVPRDPATALVWYQRAAEQGNVKAMHNAAVIAAGTEAGKPDYDIAYKWFLAASQNGLKDSQFNLAVLYERGLGTRPNVDEALFWYLVAARQDDADAKKRAEVLSQNLSPAVVETVRAKVKAWIPQQPPANANVVTIQDAAWQNSPSLTQIQPAQPAIEKQEAANDPVGLTQQLLNRWDLTLGSQTASGYPHRKRHPPVPVTVWNESDR